MYICYSYDINNNTARDVAIKNLYGARIVYTLIVVYLGVRFEYTFMYFVYLFVFVLVFAVLFIMSNKSYSFDFKMKIIREVEERKGEKNYKSAIAAKYNIPASTLSTFLRDQDKIAEKYSKQKDTSRKRAREPGIPQVDEAVTIWFTEARNNKIKVSGLMITTKAQEFANKLGHSGFKASDGWLRNWKKRNEIVYKTECGESDSVDFESAAQWMLSLDPILREYNPRDIFNADETGLFFKCEPNRTMAFKNDPCFGGKRSKERVSILVGANMVRFFRTEIEICAEDYVRNISIFYKDF